MNRVCAISEAVTLYMEGECTHYKYTHTTMGCTHVEQAFSDIITRMVVVKCATSEVEVLME